MVATKLGNTSHFDTTRQIDPVDSALKNISYLYLFHIYFANLQIFSALTYRKIRANRVTQPGMKFRLNLNLVTSPFFEPINFIRGESRLVHVDQK